MLDAYLSRRVGLRSTGDARGGAWGVHVGGVILIPLFKYRHVRLFAPRH